MVGKDGGGTIEERNIVRDGNKACCCGAYIRVAEEYKDWEVFKKFSGKVGRLTWRHFSGMWFAEFPGQAEYSFLCGPLLHQLQYATAADAKAFQMQQQEEIRQKLDQEQKAAALSALQVQIQEKRQAEMAESTRRMFEHMNRIQEGLIESRSDTEIMMLAFANASESATRLDEDLRSTTQELLTTKAELESVQSKLEDTEVVVASLKENLEKSQQDISTLQQTLTELLSLRTHDAEKLHEREQEITRLEECKKTLETEQARLMDRVAQMELDKKKLSQKEAQSQVELDKAKREYAKTFQALEIKKSDCIALEKELKISKSSVADLNKRLIQEADKFQNAVRLLEAQNRDLENQNREFEAMLMEEENKSEHSTQGATSVIEVIPTAKGDRDASQPRTIAAAKQIRSEKTNMDKLANANLRKQLATTEDKARQLEIEAESLRLIAKQYEQAVIEIARLTDTEADLTAENENLQASISKHSQHHADATKKMKDEINALAKKVNILAETESRQTERISVLTAQSAQKESEKNVLLAEGKRLHQELDDALSRCENLSDAKERAEQTIRSLQAQLEEQKTVSSDLKQSTIKLRSENGRLSQDLAVAKQREEGLISQRTEMTEAVQQAKKKMTLLEKDSSNLREKLERSDAKISELNDKVAFIPVLQKLYESNQEKANIELESLQSQLKLANSAVEELTTTVSHLRLDKFQTKAANSNLKKQVSTVLRPFRVCFVLWHFVAIIEKHENNIQDHSDLNLKLRTAQHEIASLRLRLRAAHRLVEELQTRERLLASGSSDKTPANGQDSSVDCKALSSDEASSQFADGIDVVMGSDPELLEKKYEIEAESFHSHEVKVIDDRAAHLEKLEVLQNENEGLRQRNVRLQSESRRAEDEARANLSKFQSVKIELAELQKQFSTMIGCLKEAEKALPQVRDRKQLFEAKALLKSLSLSAMEHERSVSSGKSSLVSTSISPIVSRRIELEEDAMKKKEAEDAAPLKSSTPGFVSSLSIADVEEDLESSLQLLQNQVVFLQDRLDKGDSKRRTKQASFIGRMQQGLPSITAIDKSGFPGLVSMGYVVQGTSGSPVNNNRPQSAMGVLQANRPGTGIGATKRGFL